MNEPFSDVEEMIRRLGKEASPALSLRHRVLTASRIARERQLRRIRIRQTSCWLVMSLCLVYACAQIQWSYFQAPGSLNNSELSASTSFAEKDSSIRNTPGLNGNERSAFVTQAEVNLPVFNDPIEWETADSHWKQRDRQSTLISHYF